MANRFPKPFFVFLGALLLLNLLQSVFTQLIYDEAYYWYFSQQLSWGYFDHPPMVALLIWIGNLFFDGELGVRLVSCVMGSGTITLIWLLIDSELKKKFLPHFFLLLFSMALFNAYGFLTLPDTPLLFFTALFLLVYKRFLQSPSYLLATILGLVMACLMYSKYHAILVILFVIMSNLNIVKNKLAWLAVVIALLCYVPHVLWLYEHDFAPIEYHLSERPNHQYSFSGFTLGYVLNLIVNFGLLFPWFYLALFKARPKDKFRKALVYLSYGIILFFFFSSFHRRTQAQWVIVICIPMAVLAYEHLLHHKGHRKWMYRLSIVSATILIYARLWLVYEPLLPMSYEAHGNKQWSERLKSKVGNTPVIFENSYRRAPMYAFYTGVETFTLNNIFYRLNQYSIDSSEAKMQHRKIAYVTPYAKSGEFSYKVHSGIDNYGWYIKDFESFRKLRCFIEGESIKLNEKEFTLKVFNPYNEDIPLDNLNFNVGYLNEYKQLKEKKPLELNTENNPSSLKAKDTTELKCQLILPMEIQPAYLKFALAKNGLPAGINSSSIKVEK